MAEEVGGASRYLDTQGVYAAVADRLGEPGFWALSPHDAGLGNETLFLVWGDRRFVVRRPPLAGPAGAHDLGREAHALARLEWTDLPTPRAVLAVENPDVAGARFTVQERLDGKVLRHGEPMAYAEDDNRRRVGEAVVDTLAALHAVDPEEADLDVGPDGPAERVERARTLFADHGAGTDRPVPGATEVGERLAAAVPDQPTDSGRAVVHGDYHLPNLKLTPGTPPEVVGVLDWERAGVGDPLVDLGRLVAFWVDDESAADRVGLPFELAPRFTAREGYHSAAELVARYEAATGRRFGEGRFYRALALYEAAAVYEGYYLRHLREESSRPAFADLEGAVPALVERARRIIDDEVPV